MRRFSFLFLTVISTLLLAISCNKEDIKFDAPFIHLTSQELEVPKEGGEISFSVETNRPWNLEILQEEQISWLVSNIKEGEGTKEITLTLLPNQDVDREATIKVSTKTVYEYIKIKQIGAIQTSEIFGMTFGTSAPTSSPWAYPDTYSDWGATGTGVTQYTTYTGSGASLRTPAKASSEYAGASGSSSIFFGVAQDGGNAYFQINKVYVVGATNFIINFGATRYKMGDSDANTFYPDRLILYISNNGTDWAPVNYTFQAGEVWGLATANAVLAAGSEYLYIKFEATEASTIRVDDITIKTTNLTPEFATVYTLDATDITKTTAKLSGRYTAFNVDITEAGFEYKVGDADFIQIKSNNISGATYSADLSNLAEATTYKYRAYAKSATATYYGSLSQFVTAGDTKTYITIKELREKGEGTIDQTLFVKGFIVNDQIGGNSTSLRNIIIQDATAGITVRLGANADELPLGTEVELELNGAQLSKFNGLLQVNNYPNEKMIKTGVTNVVSPVNITAAQLLSGNYESMYVSVSNVQVKEADLSKNMVVGTSHTSIGIESKNGEEFVMFSSRFSEFKDVQVPQGSGSLKGIASINNSTIQLQPQNRSDFANLTNPRFTPGSGGEAQTYLNETFTILTGADAPPTPGTAFNTSGSFPAITDFEAAGLAGWTGEYVYKAEGALKLGSSSKAGYIITPALSAIGDNSTDITLTFKAINWETNGAKDIEITIADGDGTVENGVVNIPARVDAVSGFESYSVTIKGATKNSKIKISAKEQSRNRFFLDDITVKKAN